MTESRIVAFTDSLTMATSEASSKPANKFVAIKNALSDFLHEKNSFTYLFELAERYTKLQREYIFIGRCSVWSCIVF